MYAHYMKKIDLCPSDNLSTKTHLNTQFYLVLIDVYVVAISNWIDSKCLSNTDLFLINIFPESFIKIHPV